MTYNELSDEQKNDIAAYDKFMRSLAASLSKVAKDASIVTWNQFAVTNVDSVIASLDSGELIPNSTNYIGAKPLNKTEFLGLQTILRSLASTQMTNLSLIVKAVGINAGN